MDFRILEWISGFQNGFLDFRLDVWISQWISGFHSGFLDFWISVWISADGVRDFFRDGPLEMTTGGRGEDMLLREYVDSLGGVAKSRYFDKLKALGLAYSS